MDTANSRRADSEKKSAALLIARISRRSALLRGSAAMVTAGWDIRTQAATAQTTPEHYVVFEGPINDTNTSRLMSIISTLIPRGAQEVHLIVGTAAAISPTRR